MKNSYSDTFLRLAALGSKVIFGLSLLMIVALFVLNYFDWSKGDSTFSVRGDVQLIEKNWRPMQKDLYTLKDSVGLSSIVLMKKSAFARLDYTDLGVGLSFRNVMYTLIDALHFGIWLVVFYQLMKIINAVYKDHVFGSHNIRRIRWIALIFFLAPIVLNIQEILFARILNDHIEVPNHYMVKDNFRAFRWNVFKGSLIAVTLLVLAEVFKKGMALKTENDLTV